MSDIHIGWPQAVYLTLMLLGAGVTLALHGKPRLGTYNFFSSLLATAGLLALLWWGGFFGG